MVLSRRWDWRLVYMTECSTATALFHMRDNLNILTLQPLVGTEFA